MYGSQHIAAALTEYVSALSDQNGPAFKGGTLNLLQIGPDYAL